MVSPLTTRQDIALAVLPIPSVILSFIGSTSIISSAIRNRQKGPYERLLLGMSICDIFMSVTLAFQPYLVVKGYNAVAFGNEQTCRAMGTFFQFGLSSPFYYGAISVYYLLTIRYSFTKRRLARRAEPLMHLFCLGWPFVTAFAGAVVGFYDVLSFFPGCWIDNYPKGCIEKNCLAPIITWICAGGPFVMIVFAIIVNNALIYRHVYKAYNSRRFTRRSFSGSSLGAQINQDKRIRLVATQAFLYVCALFLTYTSFFVAQVLESLILGKEKEFYPLMVFQAVLSPLAGFFNGIIFFRPRYMDIRRQFRTQTKMWSIRRTLFGSIIQPVDEIDHPISPNVSLPPFGNDDRSSVAHDSDIESDISVGDDSDKNHDMDNNNTSDYLERGKISSSSSSGEQSQTNQETTEEGSTEERPDNTPVKETVVSGKEREYSDNDDNGNVLHDVSDLKNHETEGRTPDCVE